MDAISAYELSKQYGNRTALHNMTLRVKEGERYAIVGSAGCGKTTALRLFAGLTRPSMGSCTVMGFSIEEEIQKIHGVIGVVTETAKLYQNMTVMENLRYFSVLYALDSYDMVDRISFLLHRLDIWETRDQLIRTLPTNHLQRVNYARAVLHRPKLLLMDEPTSGMDGETIQIVSNFIEDQRKQEGATTLVTTRHFRHAEILCQRFAFMEAGVISALGSLDSLRKRYGLHCHGRFRLSPHSVQPPKDWNAKGWKPLPDGSFSISLKSPDSMPEMIAALVHMGCEIYEVILEKPSLEDIYRKIYRVHLTDHEIAAGVDEDEEWIDPTFENKENEGDGRREGAFLDQSGASTAHGDRSPSPQMHGFIQDDYGGSLGGIDADSGNGSTGEGS